MLPTSPIIALDFASKEEVLTFLQPFSNPVFVKVGMELFYKEGPAIINELKQDGHAIFLDLKLYDIPNTVYKAMKSLASLQVDLVNVHAAGGTEMMKAAKQGLIDGSNGNHIPKLIAVTQLTSFSEEAMQQQQRVNFSMKEMVLHYAKLAHEAGLDGVVCSAEESELLHEQLGATFLKVTPGIRLSKTNHGDQVRVATPQSAKRQHATHIVVGREITLSDHPKETYEKIISAWEETND